MAPRPAVCLAVTKAKTLISLHIAILARGDLGNINHVAVVVVIELFGLGLVVLVSQHRLRSRDSRDRIVPAPKRVVVTPVGVRRQPPPVSVGLSPVDGGVAKVVEFPCSCGCARLLYRIHSSTAHRAGAGREETV